MTTVKLKTAPELRRLVTMAMPGYRKHDVFLSAMGSHGVNVNSYWDGGSRSTYVLVDIVTGRTKALPTRSHPHYEVAAQGMANTTSPDVEVDHAGNVTLKRLPEGIALIQAGTFCGKPATAHVYLAPENMAKLIGA